jgi:Fic family protein
LIESFSDCRMMQQELLAFSGGLNPDFLKNYNAATLTEEIVQNSAIEGESLDSKDVWSSVANHLGIEVAGLSLPLKVRDRQATAVHLDAVQNFSQTLDEARLKRWHMALFPPEALKEVDFTCGGWRCKGGVRIMEQTWKGVVVHFEGPPDERVPDEMRRFLHWFASSEGKMDGLIRAAVAHLWFVAIHPFEDGNGRLSRTITDMALAQDEGGVLRLYSVSKQIMTAKGRYYNALKMTTQGGMDITPWLGYFLTLTADAMKDSRETIRATLFKADFWERYKSFPLNDRQVKVLNKILDVGDRFEGRISTQRVMNMARSTKITAFRDLSHLLHLGILVESSGGGRNASYQVAMGIEDRMVRLATEYVKVRSLAEKAGMARDLRAGKPAKMADGAGRKGGGDWHGLDAMEARIKDVMTVVAGRQGAGHVRELLVEALGAEGVRVVFSGTGLDGSEVVGQDDNLAPS